MFYSLCGNIVYRDETSVAVECGGVAFRCYTTYNTLRQLGDKSGAVTLFTHLNVREDALDLYGFYDPDELETFKLLLGVSGVGPKAALAVLSEFTPDSLSIAVASGDAKSVTRAQGVGQKLAQRVVLELKDKLGYADRRDGGVSVAALSAVGEMSNTQSAVAALTELGYSQSEAAVAVSRLDPSLSVEQLIRAALRGMMSV